MTGPGDREDINRLRQQLAEALEARAETEDEYENNSRLPAWAALVATHNFLRDALKIEPELRAPLLHLIAALDDANNGRSNDLLTPRARLPGDQPKARVYDQTLMVAAAAAVTILQRATGMSSTKCLERVASGFAFDKGKLGQFRKNLMSTKKRANRKAVDEYHRWLQDWNEISQTPLRPGVDKSALAAVASDMVDRMIRTARRIAPPKTVQ